MREPLRKPGYPPEQSKSSDDILEIYKNQDFCFQTSLSTQHNEDFKKVHLIINVLE